MTKALALALLAAVLPAQASMVETPLPGASGWNANLIHRSEGGTWYAHVGKVLTAYGAPEVIVTDEGGRLTVLSVYSGRWTARSVNPDGQWLAPSLPADVDPRVPGNEIYGGGRAGNVHRITLTEKAHGNHAIDSVEIGHAGGEEFHTVLAADLDPAVPGDELLAFGLTGAVYGLAPEVSDRSSDHFTMRKLLTIAGRVRDAVVLPAEARTAPWVAGVSRSGDLILLRLSAKGLEHRVVAHEPMGLGRIALRKGTPVGQVQVLYVTRDDGVVLRCELASDLTCQRAPIFAGAQGLRGVASGRFHDDPARESVAVYGYGRQVQLVSRAGTGPWQAETIFSGEEQGHWLATGEIDGRNGTDELIATGFGGQVILLSRPPGYALKGVAIDPPAAPPWPSTWR